MILFEKMEDEEEMDNGMHKCGLTPQLVLFNDESQIPRNVIAPVQVGIASKFLR